MCKMLSNTDYFEPSHTKKCNRISTLIFQQQKKKGTILVQRAVLWGGSTHSLTQTDLHLYQTMGVDHV